MNGSRFLATKIAVILAIGAFFACYALGKISGWPPRLDTNHFALSKTVKGNDYLPSEQIIPSDAFRFHIAMGSGWHGYDQLLVSGDGSAQYLLQEDAQPRPIWRLATLQLSAAEVEQLCEELRQIDFGGLYAEYHADVHDGTQKAVSLQCGPMYKHVYCNNYFPSGIQRLSKYVHEEILANHQAEVDAAAEISFEKMRTFPGDARQPLLPEKVEPAAAE